MTTILLAGGGTGGHLMPALAVADATRRLHPDWRFAFAGARRGIEAKVLPDRGLPHHLLPLEPIYRQQWWKNLRWPLLLPGLIRRVDAMLDEERPDAVIGTGGYVSGPVSWRAAQRKIPTAILDLDVRPGIATRFLASRVDAIWLGTPDAIAALPKSVWHRIAVTGAPIVPPDRTRAAGARQHFQVTGDRPVVVVTGGSQGSLAINRAVAGWVRSGAAESVQLIWITGRATHAEFAKYHQPPLVQVVAFADPMGDVWATADLAVSRSGMSTLAEICAWGIPSILVPLPTSAADHQSYNARAMAAAGAAELLLQEHLSPDALATAINELLAAPTVRAGMAAAALTRARPGASIDLAERVIALATR